MGTQPAIWGLKMEWETGAKERGQPRKSARGKGRDSPLEPPEGEHSPADTLSLTQEDPCQTSNLQK